jgi:hypothetical protein
MEFLAEVEATVGLIEAHPLAWSSMSSRTRRCRTHRIEPIALITTGSAGITITYLHQDVGSLVGAPALRCLESFHNKVALLWKISPTSLIGPESTTVITGANAWESRPPELACGLPL